MKTYFTKFHNSAANCLCPIGKPNTFNLGPTSVCQLAKILFINVDLHKKLNFLKNQRRKAKSSFEEINLTHHEGKN